MSQIARIGVWHFEMPDGWKHKDNESSESYFEALDGSLGLYVKSIVLPAQESAQRFAAYIQGVHLQSYTELTDSAWEVVARTSEEQGALVRSSLDLYDPEAAYRVLSIVLCSHEEAIQVTAHDYYCASYLARRNIFSSLMESVGRSSSVV